MGSKSVDRGENIQVLHIVGHVTEAVFGFLGPASEALSEAGLQQTIVMLDDPRHRHLQARFPKSVRLETVPVDARSRRHWYVMTKVIQKLIAGHQYGAIHLHGFLPWAFGTRMGRLIPRNTKVYYSPHGSRTLSLLRPLQATLGTVMSLLGSPRHEVIASSVSDAQRVSSVGRKGPVVTIEAAIDDAFFEMSRHEARRPLLVSGDADDNNRSVELFCRLAVVLSAAELDLSFNWIGHIDPISAARLKAANVGTFAISDHKEMASRLATGWIFVAAGEADEFPILLAGAMALGLPCVVSNTAHHRDLIKHGENGLVYRSEEEALAQVSRLIDDPAMRNRLGSAARSDAQSRLSQSRLNDALVATYRTGAGHDTAQAPRPPTGQPQATH
jgi:hypothetical protein